MKQALKDHFLKLTPPSWRSWIWLTVACVMLAGCGGDEPIRIYTAPKEKMLANAAPDQPKEPQELLGAIIAKENRPWAFKMMGAPEKVALYKTEFRQLVDSFAFSDDGQPTWKLPESWSEEPGNEFTYRTFRPPNDPSIKATISELSYSFNPADLNISNWQKYVVQNVNRWRGQVSLEDQAWDQMSSDLEPIEKLSMRDLPAYYVSLKGEGAGSGGPMMGGGPMSRPKATLPVAPPDNESMPTKSQLQLVLPEGWREVAPLSTMAWKSYEADGPEGTKVQITFTPAGGDSLSNVARWAGQVGGTEAEAIKAMENVEKLEVNGKPTELYRVVGPEPNPKATTAAIVRWTSSQALFVKMSGPAPAVSAQHDAFLALVKSIKW